MKAAVFMFLSSPLPGGPGSRMLGAIPFWFISPSVAVLLTDPPDWVPDEVCSYCTACKAPFTVIRRKHHCRSCGKVITVRCRGTHWEPHAHAQEFQAMSVCVCWLFSYVGWLLCVGEVSFSSLRSPRNSSAISSCFPDLLFPLLLPLCAITSLWSDEACPRLHSLLHVPCHSFLQWQSRYLTY